MLINLNSGKEDVGMIKKITHRLGWKILSLVIAFFLWLIVVNYDDPLVTQEFKNVKVTKLNANEITSQKMHIEYIEGEYVDIKVRGKRSLIYGLSIDDFEVYADLSKVSITNAVDIEVKPIDGVDILNITPKDMTISTEEIISVQKEVTYYFRGDVAENYVTLEPSLTPNRIQITGPKSQVMMVSKVEVPITISDAKSDITLYAKLEIKDSNDNEVTTVKTDIDQVQVRVPVQLTKKVPIMFIAQDSVPNGYRLTNTNLDKTEVMVRGSEADLAKLNNIVINNVSLKDRKESATINIFLQDYLPSGVVLMDTDKSLNVTFTIEQLVEKELVFKPQDITVKNIPAGLKFSFANDSMELKLVVRGIQNDINRTTVAVIDPNIRLNGLSEGQHKVQLNYTLPPYVEVVSDPVVLDIILVKEAESASNNEVE